MNATSRQTTGQTYDLAGALHRVVLDGESTAGAATVVEVTLSPGAGIPMHSDEREDLVWYVVEGPMEFQTAEGARTLDPGASVFVRREEAHAVANTTTRPVTAVMIATPAGIEAFIRDAAAMLPPGVPSGPPPAEAIAAFAELAATHGITLHGS